MEQKSSHNEKSRITKHAAIALNWIAVSSRCPLSSVLWSMRWQIILLYAHRIPIHRIHIQALWRRKNKRSGNTNATRSRTHVAHVRTTYSTTENQREIKATLSSLALECNGTKENFSMDSCTRTSPIAKNKNRK